MGNIYAILDILAEQLVGGLQLHKHDAAAVRTFTDIASDPQTMIHRHPEHFVLLCLGTVKDDHSIHAFEKPETILTGGAWKAATDKQLNLDKDA